MYTPRMPRPTVLSVSQLNFYLKSLIENDPRLGMVIVSGEISNLTDHYSSGHIYLSLKDSRSVLRAVMFAGNARRLRFRPQNGMKVLCRGRVAVYEPSGQYQLYIEDMQPDGVGALALAYEQLKKKLQAEGLFDASRKKPLPRFPKTVGVITSPTGAAVQDIRNILYRRFPAVNMMLAPVLVQGEGAPAQLINALRQLDAQGQCDVLIIGRGGGSVEDLWAFNDEALARTIAACRTPVISAVGHETDFTICDFVADLRAPTPSAAAELAVPDVRELKAHLQSQRQYLQSLMENRLRRRYEMLLHYHRLTETTGPKYKSRVIKDRLHATQRRLKIVSGKRVSIEELKIKKYAAKLETLSPYRILSRGYTYIEQNGSFIPTASALDKSQPFDVTFADGTIRAKAVI